MKHNLTLLSALGAAAMHFLCCGLPLTAAIFGASIPALDLGPAAMKIIFATGAVLLAASWILHIKNRCDCKGRAPLVILIISTALWIAAVAAGFLAPELGMPSCH
ncbi:MAG: hypothetical protein LBL46_03800 [Rickettsiales bacterium]|jgi:hypothetical protein|nr:hypothetical protein [Rickettsiales bacterium]